MSNRMFLVMAFLVTGVVVQAAVAAADGEAFPGFGLDGVVIDGIGLGPDVDLVTVTAVVDDPDGSLLVAGWVSRTDSPDPRSQAFLARYVIDGTYDTSFSDDGVLWFPAGVASQINGLARTSFGDYVVGGLFDGHPNLFVVSIDGQVVREVDGDDGRPVSSSLELPNGRVVVGRSAGVEAGRRDVVDIVLPNDVSATAGTRFDTTFSGSIGFAFSSSPVVVTDLARRQDGVIVAAVTVQSASQGRCALAQFDAAGALMPAFGTSGILQLPVGQECELREYPDGSLLVLTYPGTDPTAISASVVSPGGGLMPVFWPSTTTDVSIEGVGRIIAPGPGFGVSAVFADGSIDDSFGINGFVTSPGPVEGVRALDSGDIVVWGTPSSHPTTFFLQLLSSPWGPAPQPYVTPMTRFVPLVPQRILDTRIGLGAPDRPVASLGEISLQVAGRGGVPAAGAVAVVLNLTATETTGAGFVTAYPSGSSRPVVSNLNMSAAGETVPNLVTVRLGVGGKIRLYAHTATELIADVAGYYVEAESSSDGRFVAVAPERILDTREGLGAPRAVVGAGRQIDVQVTGRGPVPARGVAAVALNLTGTEAVGAGFVTAWPTGLARPVASNLNLVAGDTRANLVIVSVGADGRVSFYSLSGTHLVADVAGWFTDDTAPLDSAGLFVPIVPTRVLDTRLVFDEPLPAGSDFIRRLGGSSLLPPYGQVSAVFLNATMTETVAPGYLTLYPWGITRPIVSNLNVTGAGQTRANGVIVPLGHEIVAGFNLTGTHVIFDVAGWYTSF